MEVAIDAVVAGKLGLASHQNSVPLLRQATVTAKGDGVFENLVLKLEPGLPFAVPKEWPVDRLDATAPVVISNRDVKLVDAFLADLTESVSTDVQIVLCSGDTVVARASFPVELLAHSEWGGADSMPALLAVFCTPNDPAVDKLLKAASDVLRRAGKPDGVDGYESGSRQRVWELASAIWSALCGFQISYALPPASFEQQGQKIRTPSRILEGRVATCLDTALLFAAALEQAHLNPVIVLAQGHALVGVWLQPSEFAQVIVEDASAMRKRVALDELVVFETTLATQTPAPSFHHAVTEGKSKLTDDEFVMAVDMRRARMQRLRPLSIPTGGGDTKPTEPEVVRSEALDEAPPLPDFDVAPLEPEPATPRDRIALWQRKLLDLTTRNRLLHVPDRAKGVRLVCTDPASLEDMLADGKTVRIVDLPDLSAAGRDAEIHAQRNREHLEEEFAKQAMAKAEVPSPMPRDRLDAALVELYRKSRADLLEGGSNLRFPHE